ncbi:MAG: hypothetical protein MJZ77_07535 [Bacteroidales bacterium]|nr:hypothetical protein [Bacteroidales bacterium]
MQNSNNPSVITIDQQANPEEYSLITLLRRTALDLSPLRYFLMNYYDSLDQLADTLQLLIDRAVSFDLAERDTQTPVLSLRDYTSARDLCETLLSLAAPVQK